MPRLSILLILLLGIALRLHSLGADLRLQPDEAFFSTFARAAAIKGDWFLPGPLDKPPLAIYANALAQVYVGDNELAARLPGTIAGILLLPLVYTSAMHIYGSRKTARWAMLLTALSPLLLRYTATAYTDGPMLLCVSLALVQILRGRGFSSGLWLGLGLSAKAQALFYMPLLLAIAGIDTRSPRRILRLLAGFALVAAVLLLWDGQRPGVSVFTLAAEHNNPARLIAAEEILPRLIAWLDHVALIFGPPWLTTLLLAGALLLFVWRVVRRAATTMDLLLSGFVLIYALLHWLLAFDSYERYLLPLLPVLILLLARALTLLRYQTAALILVAALLLPGSWQAVNSSSDEYRGIDDLATYLNTTPVATVIYDHWLGWELGYYLGPWHDKRMVYYPTPEALVRDALLLDEIGPRYLTAPAYIAVDPWLAALREAGFEVQVSYRNSNFIAYQLLPPWARLSSAAPL